MNYLSLIILMLYAINYSCASSKDKYSTCQIEGFKEKGSSSKDKYYYLEMKINDTFSGDIVSLKTKNIQRITSSVDYLNVTLQNSILTFSTSNIFQDFEKNNYPTKDPEIYVKLEMECVKSDSYSKVYFYQKIEDTNNHPPNFNQEYYNYSFGMPIPEGLFLNEIVPITVTDHDITNYGIDFEIDNNENFKIISTKSDSKPKYSKHHEIKLVANKQLTAPFMETIIITATDQGKPKRFASIPITITVAEPKDLENYAITNKNNKSPTFSKPVYFADYTLKHEIVMQEFITLEHAASGNTYIKQNGYEEYFNVQFEDLNYKDINIRQITNLPEFLLNHLDTITIEIEATLDFQVTSFTTLVIRLPNFGNKIMKENVPTIPNKCNTFSQNDYVIQSYSIPLILFAISVCCIIFINTYMIIIFINHKKENVMLTLNEKHI